MKLNLHSFMATAFLFSGLALISTSAYSLSCSSANPTSTKKSPYETNSKFITLINNSDRLQFPTSSTCLTQANMKAKKVLLNHWYMNGSNHLVFDFRNGAKSDRLEIRGGSFASNSRNKKWDGTYRLPSATRSEGFTIGQVFSETHNVPIMRLEVIKERKADGTTYNNHLFAIWRPSSGGTLFKSLGPVPAVGKNGKVAIIYGTSNGRIKVTHTVGTVSKVSEEPIGGYDSSSQKTYFKAGCYLQDPGDCRVTFTALTYNK